MRPSTPKPCTPEPNKPCPPTCGEGIGLCGGGISKGDLLNTASGVAGSGSVETGNSLAESQNLPECKWILDRYNRPVRQKCNKWNSWTGQYEKDTTCRCSSRG